MAASSSSAAIATATASASTTTSAPAPSRRRVRFSDEEEPPFSHTQTQDATAIAERERAEKEEQLRQERVRIQQQVAAISQHVMYAQVAANRHHSTPTQPSLAAPPSFSHSHAQPRATPSPSLELAGFSTPEVAEVEVSVSMASAQSSANSNHSTGPAHHFSSSRQGSMSGTDDGGLELYEPHSQQDREHEASMSQQGGGSMDDAAMWASNSAFAAAAPHTAIPAPPASIAAAGAHAFRPVPSMGGAFYLLPHPNTHYASQSHDPFGSTRSNSMSGNESSRGGHEREESYSQNSTFSYPHPHLMASPYPIPPTGPRSSRTPSPSRRVMPVNMSMLPINLSRSGDGESLVQFTSRTKGSSILFAPPKYRRSHVPADALTTDKHGNKEQKSRMNGMQCHPPASSVASAALNGVQQHPANTISPIDFAHHSRQNSGEYDPKLRGTPPPPATASPPQSSSASPHTGIDATGTPNTPPLDDFHATASVDPASLHASNLGAVRQHRLGSAASENDDEDDVQGLGLRHGRALSFDVARSSLSGNGNIADDSVTGRHHIPSSSSTSSLVDNRRHGPNYLRSSQLPLYTRILRLFLIFIGVVRRMDRPKRRRRLSSAELGMGMQMRQRASQQVRSPTQTTSADANAHAHTTRNGSNEINVQSSPSLDATAQRNTGRRAQASPATSLDVDGESSEDEYIDEQEIELEEYGNVPSLGVSSSSGDVRSSIPPFSASSSLHSRTRRLQLLLDSFCRWYHRVKSYIYPFVVFLFILTNIFFVTVAKNVYFSRQSADGGEPTSTNDAHQAYNNWISLISDFCINSAPAASWIGAFYFIGWSRERAERVFFEQLSNLETYKPKVVRNYLVGSCIAGLVLMATSNFTDLSSYGSRAAAETSGSDEGATGGEKTFFTLINIGLFVLLNYLITTFVVCALASLCCAFHYYSLLIFREQLYSQGLRVREAIREHVVLMRLQHEASRFLQYIIFPPLILYITGALLAAYNMLSTSVYTHLSTIVFQLILAFITLMIPLVTGAQITSMCASLSRLATNLDLTSNLIERSALIQQLVLLPNNHFEVFGVAVTYGLLAKTSYVIMAVVVVVARGASLSTPSAPGTK